MNEKWDHEEVKFKDEKHQKYEFKIKTSHKLALFVVALVLIIIGLLVYMPILNPVYSQSIWIFLVIITILYFILLGEKAKGYIIIGLFAVVFIATFVLTTPILWSGKYYDMIGDVETYNYQTDAPNIDDTKIPVVDQSLAENLGDKKLGEDVGLGSQYTVGEYYFINTDEDLAWVAPLEPRSFFKWFQNRAGAPGYIYVSATNPNDVRLVTDLDGKDLNIKYTNESYWFSNIKRHVYINGNMTTGLTDFSFEIDDEGNPYWIVTTYAPSFNIFAGRQATGVVVVNAQSGEVEKYGIDEEMPSWIERVWPTSFINEQIKYYGAYKNGWLNSVITQKEMIMPTDGFSYVFIEGEPYLYTGMSSVQSDQSTVGMMLVSLTDKTSQFYKLTGATEYAAMASSEGQVQQYEYSATFPILLNTYGQPTYFMTLKDRQGLIKQYSFVSVENYNIVGIGDTISSAQKDYYDKLKSNGMLSSTDTQTIKEQTGTIDRVNIVNNVAYIKFKNSENIYLSELDVSDQLYVSQAGDKVKYKVDGTNIVEFDNLSL